VIPHDDSGWLVSPLEFVVMLLAAIVVVLLGWLGVVFYLVSFS
jgi:hypothetical protein